MTHTQGTDIHVSPLSGSIGAEVTNIDLSVPLSESCIRTVRQLWLDYKVIFFPAQDLTPAQHKIFAAQFGEITNGHPVLPEAERHNQILEIDYTKARLFEALRKDSEGPSTNTWHTDVTFMECPPLGTVLNAIEMPAAGGDTVFADTSGAFEALSKPMQLFLSQLSAVHDGRPQYQRLLDGIGVGEWNGEKITAIPPVTHPVVRLHPETGRPSLFVNPGFTLRISELNKLESGALLDFLFEHMTRQEFLVRYRWRAGDLGFWDNRCTMHYAVFDYGSEHRVIQRVTLRGDSPTPTSIASLE